MFTLKRRSLSIAVLAIWILHIFSPIMLTTYADNTAYYVDATGGSDANDGLSSLTPWQSLAHVSTQTFLPGDQILLKCGESWTDTLTLDDSGISGNEIIVSTYGACSSTSVATLANTGASQIDIVPGAEYVRIQNITFLGGTGVTMSGADNVQFLQNRFQGNLGNAIDIFGSTNFTITENYFNLDNSVTGVKINKSTTADILNNTFSGGIISLNVLNSSTMSVFGNTFYNPYTYAIGVIEDTSVSTGTVYSVTISNNTILTWNPSYAMIYMDDQNAANGTLANVTGNHYINVYKALSPLVRILQFGSPDITFNKNDITNFDASAKTFLHFGYSSYNADVNPTDTKLYVNTGSTSVDRPCNSGSMSCGANSQVNINGQSITFPTSVPAYGSKIILWNNPSSIQNPPTCSLSANPGGDIPNGGSVNFTWNVTNSLSTIFSQPNGTGGTIDSSVSNIGSGTYFPPGISSNNIYTLTAINNIGPKICTADIVTQNNAPTADTFFMTGSEDSTTITGTLIATDQNGDSITYSKFPDNSAQPANGTLTIGVISGLVTYTPNPNFCGVDTFSWRAFDQYIGSIELFGSITVLCANDTPVAIDDTLNATGGQLAILAVTLNDSDIDSTYQPQVFTVSGVSLPSHGILVASGSVFELTPDSMYMGSDSFTYVTIDQSGAVSNTGTVSLSIAPGMNIPPTVSTGSFTLTEDGAVSDVFSGSDLNGDSLSYSASVLPVHGTLTIVGSGFTYTPNANYNGTDSFTVEAFDGNAVSSGAIISLTVTSLMDIPVAVADTVNIEMDTASNIDVVVNDTDADNPYQAQILTLTGISAPTNGTASILGNQIRYTPNSLYLGADTIAYTISDQDGNISNTGTVNITVSTTNQVPVADSGSFILTEDIPLIQTLSGSDPDLTPVTFVLNVDVTHGNLVLSSTGGFTYTPDANYNGTDSFTFHVTDGVFSSSVQTVTLTINAQNDNPLAVADSFVVNEDGSISTTPLNNDSDVDVGDTFSILSITQPVHGTTTLSGSFVTYSPIADYCGSDTFEYTTVDQSGATSNVGAVSMTVTCINDTPSSTGAMYMMTGNILVQTGNILNGTLSGSDIDIGDTLTYVIVQDVSSGALTLTGNQFSYIPDINFTGSEIFTYTVTDSGGLTSSMATVMITVLQNNYTTTPTAYSGTFVVNEDGILTNSLSGTDIDSTVLTFILDQDVIHGNLNLNSSGTFTYTPNANYFGTDVFTFHISDGTNASSIATGSITINSINDAPIALTDTATGSEDSQLVINPTVNDLDIENTPLVLSAHSQGSHGTVTASGNILTYNPTANYCGTDSVTYSVLDGALATSNTGTINITLSCINDAPVAVADSATGSEDTSFMIPVLANDSDSETGTLVISSLTQPSTGGTVQVSGSNVLFVPTPNFCSTNPITFTYQARDTSLAVSAVTTLTVDSIACINDTPVSMPSIYTMSGNVVINSGTLLSGSTLTGYLESNNTLTRTLVAIDVENDILAFSASTLPQHGTLTLSATGYLTYIPTVWYIGSDSFTYIVTDGTGTTSPITVTINVQDPNPPVIIAPVTGPGGGGGGGGSSSSSSSPIFTMVSSSIDTNTGLTSQLLLVNTKITTPTSSTIDTKEIVKKTYMNYFLPLVDLIEESKSDTISSADRATNIRQSGQRIIRYLTKSVVLSSEEKMDALSATASDIQSMNSIKVPTREFRSLSFIIRILKRERVKIEKGIDIITTIVSM